MGACSSSRFPLPRKKGNSNREQLHTGCVQNHDSHAELDLNGKSMFCTSSSGGTVYNCVLPSNQENFVFANFCSERLISVCDLYNILSDSGIRPYIHDPFHFLVIDSRDVEVYSRSHVVTAHSHAKFMNNTKKRELLPKYALIVIYGDEIKDDKPSQQLLKLMHRIEEYVASDILVLQDGFHMFNKQYPYLCSDEDNESLDDRKLLLCYPSAIMDGVLYQGRGDQARNEKIMTTLGITHIVNISEHGNTFPHKIEYFRLPLDDNVTTNLLQHFNQTYDFIKNALDSGGCVLIHCNLGISRSSTITLAYLMKYKKWNLQYAYNFLKAIRTCASPNSGFLRQLSEWEVDIFGEKHTDIDAILKTYGSLKR